jgi:FkbM family methyltransferase
VNPSRVKSAGLVVVLLVCVSVVSGLGGVAIGRRDQINQMCCLVPRGRNIVLSIKETLGLVSFPSQIGQDRWVSETVFPGVTDGFFLDVGSGDGTIGSNTKALEQRGWTGICIDPFPTNMQDRTCKMFKDVVHSQSGRRVVFRQSGELGGIEDTLGRWKEATENSRTIELTTVTLGEILETAKAPRFIHFVSLDIEGGELEALRGFPFDKYQIGALAVEHNFEEPKRRDIEVLMKSHGYKRVYSWYQDDFYLPAESKLPVSEGIFR